VWQPRTSSLAFFLIVRQISKVFQEHREQRLLVYRWQLMGGGRILGTLSSRGSIRGCPRALRMLE
jgi:hypothetical protein